MRPTPDKAANRNLLTAISKVRCGAYFLILSAIFSSFIFAEPVEFSGLVGTSSDQNWTLYDSSQRNSSEFRLNLNPTMKIYDVPLSFDLLLSTDENLTMQALNKFKVTIKPQKVIGTIINNPNFGLTIPEINAGNFNPNYSNLVLANTPVNGFSVEIKPWITRLAFTTGRTQRPVESSDTSYPAYSRMLYAGSIGFGEKKGSYFDLTILHSMDDPNSISCNYFIIEPYDSTVPPETVELVKPQENYILGAKLNLQLFGDILKLVSEASASEFTRDLRMPILRIKQVPDWVENTLRPRMSSQADISYKIRPVINIFNTQLSGGVKMVGPGYQSMGVQFMRNDIFGYDFAVERSFFNNQVSLSGSYVNEKDNLIKIKRLTTYYSTFTVNLGANFPNIPSLQITCSPSNQKDDVSKTSVLNLSMSSYYSFNTGKLSHSPGISFYYQSRQSTTKSSIAQISLSHSVDFSAPFSFSVNATLDNTASDNLDNKSVTVELSPSYTFFGWWRNNLSLNGIFETAANRYDVKISSSFPIPKIAEGSFNLSRSLYTSNEDDNFKSWTMSASINKSW
jgi:hypothetical protein